MTQPLRPPAPIPLSAEVVRLARTLEEAGHEAWCVGGAIRDFLLGNLQSDVDLATSAPPEEVLRLFKRTVPVGIAHGTVGVLDQAGQLHEITTFRKDVRTDGRHAEVAYGVSLEEDLARRDFTINAIAYHPIRHEWRDPHHGTEDLKGGLVRAVGVAEERFREDYLRILRGLRFAARFGFQIEPETWAAMQAAARGLAGLSAERVRDEWLKGLTSAQQVLGFIESWHAAGAAEVALPELRRNPPLAAPDPPPRDPVLLTALVVADPGGVLTRLRGSKAEIARVNRIAEGPAGPAELDPVTVRRWLAAVGPAADDLLRSHLIRTGKPAPWAAVVAEIRVRGDALDRASLRISGHELAEAGLARGPAMGTLLSRLLDEVLQDPARNTREHLMARARDWA
ncbi:MAG: CCA tRNA nucleotidyltransferase [Gemmatimonadota bacterium]|nr:CCA tRNA nucleotidyltransferase [Gemmatimonadota bacterium]